MNEWLRRALALPEQASTYARDIDTLHYFVIITTMLGAFAVAATLLVYVIRYRERPEQPRDPRGPAIPVAVEVGVFGGLLGLFVLWWVIGFTQYTRIADPPPNAIPIYVIGKQWMWSFAYPNGTGSNGVLYVPAGRPVKLVVTSRDVIHSFYVPDFRVKRDVLPGRSTTLWFEAKRPGRHRVFCAEYCGTDHSMMLGEVVVLSAGDYERTLAGLAPIELEGVPYELPGPREPSLAAIGERVAARAGCMRCHTADGTPHIGPTWAGLFETTIPLANGTRVVADSAYLTRSMMDPMADVHRGFLPVMPSYQGKLSAADVGAILEYIRSLRDVPRRDGELPLPASTGNVPIVTPLESPELKGSAR